MNPFIEKIVEKAVDVGVNILTSAIDAESNMQLLEKNVQRLSCKASDIEEKLNAALWSGKKKRKSEVENWLDEVRYTKAEFEALQAQVAEGFCSRVLSQDPLGKMQDRVKELIEQSNFEELVLDDFDNIGEGCPPTKLVGQTTQQNFKRIWPCLVTDNISNIGIYGMGGVGKTTLARHIKYQLEEKNYRVCWVTVSQEFKISSLQDKIANVLGLHLSNEDNEEVRANILREAMGKKEKFVLILDDVWDVFRVEEVGLFLGASKCRLILTTRSLDVCNKMRCQRKFEVKTLNTDESWELMKYTLGPEGILAKDVEEIAKSVTAECAGLPLAIITVAGSMRGISNIEEWRNALVELQNVEHEEMGKEVIPILEWSYNRLNIHQQFCFLYCCLLSEDDELLKTELIKLFIWAELMKRRDTRESEFDQGKTILNHLIRCCLVEENITYNGDEGVKMHDLIRDMAIGIGKSSTKQGLRFLVKSKRLELEEWREDLNAVSIWGLEEEIQPDMSPKCPKLSTLFFGAGTIKTIPDSFFRHMCGLTVLILNGCEDLEELPNCVSDMVNLTALVLQCCADLTSVPALGKLTKLRELDLANTAMKDIPQGLEELVRLEYFDMECSWEVKKIIPKGTFSKLGHLKQLVLPLTAQLSDLGLLEQLELFSGCLSLADISELIKVSRLPKYDKLVFTNIHQEFIYYGNRRMEGETLFFDVDDSYRGLHVLPLTTGIFPSLTAIEISECHKLKKLFPVHLLQTFKQLECLEVRACYELEEIAADEDEAGGAEGGVESTSSGSNNTVALLNLRTLILVGLPRLKNICKATIMCNSTCSIEVVRCPELKRLPLFLPTVNELPNAPRNSITIKADKEWWDSLEWDNPESKQAFDVEVNPLRWQH